MVQLLAKGDLDVDLATGQPVSFAKYEEGRPLTIRTDEDGYCFVALKRKVSGRVKRNRQLWMKAFIHRLVMVKANAVDEHGNDWRQHVADIPGDIDVDHIDRDRTNNCVDNLRLRDWYNHRSGQPYDETEVPF